MRGAAENNLKEVDVEVPLGLLVAVTGVSGSGKSTLVDQVLYRNLRRQFGLGESEPGACAALLGRSSWAGVMLVDQSPLGASQPGQRRHLPGRAGRAAGVVRRRPPRPRRAS